MSSTDGRVLGQQVSPVLVFPDRTIVEFGPIMSMSLNFVSEMPKQGYLGERADRYDEIYKGIEGKLDAHLDNPKYFDFVAQILLRQQRLKVFVINLQAPIQFSNGATRRALVPDISVNLGNLDVGGRAEYVKHSLDFGASYMFVKT